MTDATPSIVSRAVRAFARLAVVWQLVIRRSLSNWRLLSSVVIGVLLASSLMAGTVLYFDALRETALKSTLAQAAPTDLDIVLQSTRGPTTQDEYLRLNDAAVDEINARVSWMVKGSVRAGRSPTMFLARPGMEEAAGSDNARTYFVFIDGLGENVEVAQWGRLPTDGALHGPGEPPSVEAVVPREAAELFGVGVGDSLVAVPTWTDDAPFVNVVISGVFDRAGPGSEFWHLDAVMGTAAGEEFRTIPFYVTESAFLNVVGPPLLKMDSTYYYLLDVDEGRLNARNAPIAAANLLNLGAHLDTTLNEYLQATTLDDVIRRYDRRLFFSKLPMYMVLALIGVVVLYYVATLSSLVVETRRNEVVLLRSRGGSSPQVLVVFVLEGLTIAVLATVAAPLVAAAAISLMGLTPAFSDLTGGGLLDIRLSSTSFMLGAVGGVLGLVALVLPAFQVSRTGVIRHRQEAARPTALPAFQRYYVDVLLLIVSIYLFRQLTEQGSVVATDLLGESAVSELLLALPRPDPHSRGGGAAPDIPHRHEPGGQAAVGLDTGWPGHGHMADGAEPDPLRPALAPAHPGGGPRHIRVQLRRDPGEELPGARSSLHRCGRQGGGHTGPRLHRGGLLRPSRRSTQACRVSGRPRPVLRKGGQDLSRLVGIPFDMFAVDPAVFGGVAFFRDDYAEGQIEALLPRLDHSPPVGLELPAGAESLTVRVKPDRPHPGVRMTAQVRDAGGEHRTLSLGRLASGEWEDLAAEIPEGLGQAPFSLVSLRVHETDPFADLQAGSLLLDEISVSTPGGDVTLESFGDVDWTALLSTDEAISDAVGPASAALPVETGSALFTWSEGAPQTIRGIFKGSRAPADSGPREQAVCPGHGPRRGR